MTGLIVLPNKRMARLPRCMLDSADHTHLSRVLSEAPWREAAVNRRRIRDVLQETQPPRHRRRDSMVVLDDTLCEPVGSLLDHVDRHDHHRAGTSPLAHHPVTSFAVSGPGRFPVGWRRYRRDAELTPWEATVAKHGPESKIPTAQTARNRLPQQVDAVLLQAPDCRARHAPCRPNMALARDLVEATIRHQVPCGVVVCDAWSLAEEVVQVLARRRKDWSSRLKQHRRLATASCQRRDAKGWAMKLPGPHLAVEDLVSLSPGQAYRPVTGRGHPSWGFTLGVRIPGLSTVRLVVSVE